jgi:hypothetical protein
MTVSPVAKPALRALALVIPAGRTDLIDGVYVERAGDSAEVHFDTEAARTRRRDKFEQTVRATLPALYGARADSLLVAIPGGEITGGKDLIGELAVHGIRVPLGSGDTLMLRPQTRPGRDGPLVVSYRVRVTP